MLVCYMYNNENFIIIKNKFLALNCPKLVEVPCKSPRKGALFCTFLSLADPISLSTSSFMIYNNSIVSDNVSEVFMIRCTWVDGYGPAFLRTDNPQLENYLEAGNSQQVMISGFLISTQELSNSVTLFMSSATIPETFPAQFEGNYFCHSGQNGNFVTALFVPGMLRL